MKIAFVLLDAQITGGQVVAHELMRAARDAGHDVVAIFPRPGPMTARVAEGGIAVVVTPLERTFRLDQALRLAWILRREQVDVVDTHTLFVGNQLARLAGRLAHVPVVAHVHISERFSTRRWAAVLQRAVDARTRRWCAAVIAVSAQLAAETGRRAVVVHNGVPIRPLSPRAWSGGDLLLLCIARLAPVKGQDVLLEAAARAGGGVRISFVGEDLERDHLYRRELDRLADGLDVAFLGRRSDVPRLLDGADVLVLPSYAEGLPLVVLEAMERGCAVIATAVGGTPEAVADGLTGLLVAPGDVAALAAAIRRLRDDRDLVRRLGAAGRARVVDEFSSERMAAETLAVLAAAAGA